MLQMPGCSQAVMVTDGPAKLEGLARAGIGAIGQIAPQGSINSDDRRCLSAKVTRAGRKHDRLLPGVESGPVGCDEARHCSMVAQRALA